MSAGWLAASVKTKNQPTTVEYQKLEEAFLQGDESEAAEIFTEMIRKSVRLGLLSALEEEVTSLCGPRYRPDPESLCHRAGSEKGSAYINGAKEELIRPRVRHEEEGEAGSKKVCRKQKKTKKQKICRKKICQKNMPKKYAGHREKRKLLNLSNDNGFTTVWGGSDWRRSGG